MKERPTRKTQSYRGPDPFKRKKASSALELWRHGKRLEFMSACQIKRKEGKEGA